MNTSANPNEDRPRELTPSSAERSRTLVAAARAGALSTLARHPAGFPYGSLVTLVPDDRGRPILLLSSLAEHTQNLTAHAEASVLITEPLPASGSVLDLARVSLIGACTPLAAEERDAARRIFLAGQPEAAAYVDFRDFAFYRLEPVTLRYVGGFGRMSWVGAAEYVAAEPDPLAGDAAGILAHMNGDHGDAVLTYARGLAQMIDASAATMTTVDRYGFDLVVTTPGGEKKARVAFEAPATTPDAVRRAMVALVKAARAALG
jgi:putative heme iron utilization protein